MNERWIGWLLKSYPAPWRAEYGPELEALLRERPLTLVEVLDVLRSGVQERARQPVTQFFFLVLFGAVVSSFIAFAFAVPLWRTLADPVIAILRTQGAHPSALIQTTPYEGIEVVWFGIPLSAATFTTFGWALVLIWILFAQESNRHRQWAKEFVLWSGSLLIVSSTAILFAWRYGWAAKLLALCPDSQNAPFVSIGHCFGLFAASTIAFAILPQLPVLAFFGWRLRRS